MFQIWNKQITIQHKLYNNQRNAQRFLFTSLFTSALHVSGFIETYFQESPKHVRQK
jgi:hypothetical protein